MNKSPLIQYFVSLGHIFLQGFVGRGGPDRCLKLLSNSIEDQNNLTMWWDSSQISWQNHQQRGKKHVTTRNIVVIALKHKHCYCDLATTMQIPDVVAFLKKEGRLCEPVIGSAFCFKCLSQGNQNRWWMFGLFKDINVTHKPWILWFVDCTHFDHYPCTVQRKLKKIPSALLPEFTLSWEKMSIRAYFYLWF